MQNNAKDILKIDNITTEKEAVGQYHAMIDSVGLHATWNNIINYCMKNGNHPFFNINNFGELYEDGLAYVDKSHKKENGQYYTPKDVCNLMSLWLKDGKGTNVCDVGCGVGNLILSYLELIGYDEARRLIKNGNIYIYDLDMLALEIAKYSIAMKYGEDLLPYINAINLDFLDKSTKLPKDCKIIANPPYSKISNIRDCWEKSLVVEDSKETYSAFIEKILKNSESSVVISPYSFLGGGKFYSLRRLLNHYNGFIVSYDNVPGNIFNGKKHGIFNSNKSNSVRAAITVTQNLKGQNGYRISPLIRFKTEERQNVLNRDYLEGLLGNNYQIIDNKNKSYYKCFKELEPILNSWRKIADIKLKDLLSTEENQFGISFPNTCRYFTTATKYPLKRTGYFKLYAKDEKSFNYLYCILNSSLAYWHWRLFDGGINFPLSLLLDLPVVSLSNDSVYHCEIEQIVKEMNSLERSYIVTKMNAGAVQENVKFPVEYRNKLNEILLRILNRDEDFSVFDVIHSNKLMDKQMKNKNVYEFVNKLYDKKPKLILTTSQIKNLDKYYKSNFRKFSNIEEFLNSDSVFCQNISKSRSALCEVKKQFEKQEALQGGILLECFVAQSIADVFGLKKFVDMRELNQNIPVQIKEQIKNKARYLYYLDETNNFFAQYGDPQSVDAEMAINGCIFKIEIKDILAKAGENDILGLYGEDGKLTPNEKFKNAHPEHLPIIEKFNKETSILHILGHNYKLDEHDTYEALEKYFDDKEIDVLVTVNKKQEILFITKDQIRLLSTKGSEIRTIGRNAKAVFTPNFLMKSLKELNAEIIDGVVYLPKSDEKQKAKGRGKDEETRLKMKNIFFCKLNLVKETNNFFAFKLEDIKQTKPTISMHISLGLTQKEMAEIYKKKKKD